MSRPYTLAAMDSIVGTAFTASSGTSYMVTEALQEREHITRNVYLAESGNEQFVLKSMMENQYGYYEDMYRKLQNSKHVRLLHDTVPENGIFIFRYLRNDLLDFALSELPTLTIKHVLRDALRGIAELHAHNIVHTDIKPTNFFLDYYETAGTVSVEQVQLSDLEDAMIVQPGQWLGCQFGNDLWRSPEAWARGPIGKPSDMFSFGIVCIYAVTKMIIFQYSPEDLEVEGQTINPAVEIVERMVSYFAEPDTFDAFIRYLGNSELAQLFEMFVDNFDAENPRQPFRLWLNVQDEDFRDLVTGLTNFDPARRLTAQQALQHKWFAEVETGTCATAAGSEDAGSRICTIL